MSSRNVVMAASGAITASGDPYFKNNTLLLYGDGTNGAQNNTFVGKKYLSATDPVGYSVYFDGTGDYLTLPSGSSFQFGTGDFTVECWINSNVAYASQYIMDARNASQTANWCFGFGLSGTAGRLEWYNGSAVTASSTTVPTVGNWAHVAYVRSGTTGKIYLNGTEVASGTDSANYTISPTTSYIGSRYSTDFAFNGYISNLRVVKGTALYTTNFTVPSTPLTAVSGTSLLTCQSATIIDNSGNNFTITVAGNAVASATNSVNITRNGNTTQGSFSPYGNLWSNYFNGTTDGLTFTSSGAAINFTGAFTVECWFCLQSNLTYIGSATSYFGRLLNGTGVGGIEIGITSASNATTVPSAIVVSSYGNTPVALLSATGLTIPLGTWHHVAVSRDASNNMSIYFNGVRVVTGTRAGTYASTTLSVGGSSTATNYLGWFPGYISNVRVVKDSVVYDPSQATLAVPTAPLTAITNTSLLACQSNRFIDNSSNNFAITINGSVKVTNFSPFPPSSPYSVTSGASAYFDGSDYLSTTTTGTVFGTDNFTIEFFVYPLTAPSTNWNPFLAIGASGGGKEIRISQNINNTGYGYLIPNNAGSADIFVGFGTLPLNQWHHLALVRNGSTVTFYRNGQVIGSTSSVSFNFTNTGALDVGYGKYPSDGYTTCYISDLRVIKGTALYTSTFTPPTAPLTAIANTSLLLNFDNAGIFDATAKNNLETIGNVQINTTTKKYGAGSMYFDGTGDGLVASNSPNYILASGDFTIEFWVNFASLNPGTGQKRLFGFQNGTAAWSNYSYFMNLNATNKLVFNYANGTTLYSIVGPTAVTNTWYHIAIARSGTNTIMFVNGVSQGFVILNTFNAIPDGKFFIGIDTDGAFNLDGYIDDFRVTKGIARYTNNFTPADWGTDTALLSDQYYKYVSLLLRGNGTNAAQNNTFIDSSSNNLTITRAGNTTQGTFSPFSSEEGKWSNYFNGTTDYLTVPSNAAFSFGTGDFTVEFWVYYPPISNTNGKTVLDSRPTSTNGSYWIFGASNTGIMTLYTMTTGGTIIADTVARPNQWVHYAATRSGTTLRLFANGTQVASATDSSNISSSGLRIGTNAFSSGAPDTYWLGNISNVRIVKGTALYTSNFTVPTSPLNVVSGTSLLTCQSNRFKDNSSNNFAITVTGDTKVLPYSPFAPSAAYDPLVNGGSGYFDGTGDYLTTAYSTTAYDWWTSDYTIEAWVYPTTLAGWVGNTIGPSLIGNMTPTSTVDYWSFGPFTGNVVKFYYFNGAEVNTVVSTETIKLNQWNHIAMTKTSSGIVIWVNGVGTSPIAISGTPQSAAATGLTIGSYNNTAINGYASNIRIVKGTALYTSNFTPPITPPTAIANTSLLCNFTNAGIIDTSAKVIAETIGNAQISTSVKKYGTGSMYFDGSGDYLTMRYGDSFNFGTGDFTIEMWVYPLTTNHMNAALFTQEYTTTPISLYIGLNGGTETTSGNQIGFGIYNGSAWVFQSFGLATLPLNAWTHVALVRSGTTFTMFVNGIQVNTTTNATSCSLGTTNYLVGRRWDTAGSYPYFNGYIDELRVTKGIARYIANFTPPTTTLPNQ